MNCFYCNEHPIVYCNILVLGFLCKKIYFLIITKINKNKLIRIHKNLNNSKNMIQIKKNLKANLT